MPQFLQDVLSWGWLVRFGPGWVALVFLLADFGMLVFMRGVQVQINGGVGEPRGLSTFWMVFFYDAFMLPLAALIVVKEYRRWQLFDSAPWGLVLASIVAGVGVVSAYLYQTPEGYADWSTGNIAGLYHTIFLGVAASFFVLFLLRVVFEGHWQESRDAFGLIVLLVVIAAPAIFFLMDSNQAFPKPNDLVARLTGRPFNW